MDWLKLEKLLIFVFYIFAGPSTYTRTVWIQKHSFRYFTLCSISLSQPYCDLGFELPCWAKLSTPLASAQFKDSPRTIGSFAGISFLRERNLHRATGCHPLTSFGMFSGRTKNSMQNSGNNHTWGLHLSLRGREPILAVRIKDQRRELAKVCLILPI